MELQRGLSISLGFSSFALLVAAVFLLQTNPENLAFEPIQMSPQEEVTHEVPVEAPTPAVEPVVQQVVAPPPEAPVQRKISRKTPPKKTHRAIVLTQAAPVQKEQKIKDSEVEADGFSQEHLTMQAIYLSLRDQFRVTLDTQPVDIQKEVLAEKVMPPKKVLKVRKQVVAEKPIQTTQAAVATTKKVTLGLPKAGMSIQRSQATVSGPKLSVHQPDQAQSNNPIVGEMRAELLQIEVPMRGSIYELKEEHKEQNGEAPNELPQTIQAAPTNVTTGVVTSESTTHSTQAAVTSQSTTQDEYSNWKRVPSPSYKNGPLNTRVSEILAQTEVPMGIQQPSIVETKVETPAETKVETQVDIMLQKEVAAAYPNQIQIPEAATVTVVANTVTAPVPNVTPVAPVVPPAPTEETSTLASLVDPSADSRQTKKSYRDRAVEAFAWETAIEDFEFKTFSYEGEIKNRTGRWVLAESQHHIPSLTWDRPDRAEDVPVFSENTLVMLEKFLNFKYLIKTGIVFGKLAPGWEVEFSGRSEKVLLFDENSQIVSLGTSNRTARYFVLLNAQPGAHLLFVRMKSMNAASAVAVPVLQGTATYLDLSEPTSMRVSGHVYDANEVSVEPVEGAQVEVVGLPQWVVTTDKSGSFAIDGLITFGNYPIYLETNKANEFKHRYRFSPSKLKDLRLYRFGGEVVSEWMAQLSGGISPQSGLLVVGLPGLSAKKFPDSQLYPEIQTLQPGATLTPETYTLAIDGRLEVRQPLERLKPRYMGVQLPEGLLSTKIRDQSGKVVWMRTDVVSPGVINLIGPE